ncbi:homeobox protein MSX-1-like [Plutella xylostella]|uniref:homeobox protein MSX-1-like n=1 Tax=Plutella xylostella TaxID=51655 RepID=UPI002032A1B9|nr:homeobox protein MSX-1-like [Plutella xylostella]
MEVSPVHSGAKGSSSDFSIERILSSEPRAARQAEPPSWLYCTRYHPPKLPLDRHPFISLVLHAGSSTSCCPRRSGRHARVPFTAAQAAALEAAYAREPYLAPPALRALASALQLRDDRIKIWFQNRRARERREKCTSIAPPHVNSVLRASCHPHPAAAPAWHTGGLYTRSPTNLMSNQYNPARYMDPEGLSTMYRSLSSEGVNMAESNSGEVSSQSLDGLSTISSENDDGRPETPLDIETVDT